MNAHELGTFSDILFYLERRGIEKDDATALVMQVFGWGINAAFARLRTTSPVPDDFPKVEQPQLSLIESAPVSGQLSMIEGLPLSKPRNSRKKKEPSQAACRWPEDFRLEDVQIKFATDRGFDRTQTQRLWELFRDRNLARGFKYEGRLGWEAAWRTWVNQEVKFSNKDNQQNRNRIDDRL